MTQQPVNSQPASGAALNPRLQEIADDFRRTQANSLAPDGERAGVRGS